MSRVLSEFAFESSELFFSELFQEHPAILLHAKSNELEIAPLPQAGVSAALLRLWSSASTPWSVSVLQQVLQLVAQPVCAVRCQPHPALPAALELQLEHILDEAAVSQLRDLAPALGLELNYATSLPILTEPGVLVMDMDSTAIEIECIDEIAALAGVGPQVAAVTAAAMRGELDFAQSLRQRVATLKDAPATILAEVLENLPLMPGLEALVSTLLHHGWTVAIASGGFTYFTRALQQQLGLTATFANELEIVDGKLTGQVLGQIVDAQVKAQVVQRLAVERQIPLQQTVAIGDGANDLPMLAVAGLGVAFHAKPLVQAQAKYAIRQGSLLQLLYLFDSADPRR